MILRPILHRDEYTLSIESEILAWMNEAFFMPLLIDLRDFRVPVSAQYQAIKYDETGAGTPTRSNAKPMEMYDDALGGLGLKRSEMPQIENEHKGALIQFLKAKGITYTEEKFRPGQMKPTQEGFYPEAVERAWSFGPSKESFIVSRDGYLLDGHHRWTAALLHDPDTKLNVMLFNVRVRPLIEAIHSFPSATRENASVSAIEEALNSGRIHYADGVFSGRFGAKISRELHELGARFDARDNTFRIAIDKLPLNMRGAIVSSAAQSKALHEQVIATLNAMQANIATAPQALDFNRAVEFITNDLGKQYAETTGAVESISVQAEFTPAMRKKLDVELTNNLNLSIKDFAQERIPELRRRVEENVLAGMRTDQLAKIIESEFGVDKRKAAFLADQEAGLVTAKYREQRYSTLGIEDYVWQTSGDIRVRHDHRLLNGRRFSFSSPPVTDLATGRRCNPGEDFRCRCTARPIVVFNGVETGTDMVKEDAA